MLPPGGSHLAGGPLIRLVPCLETFDCLSYSFLIKLLHALVHTSDTEESGAATASQQTEAWCSHPVATPLT